MLEFHRIAFFFLFFAPVFSTVVITGYNSTLDTSTCVAPKAYEACYANYVTATSECLAIASTVDEKEACACAGSALQIQCFAEACWNKVYGCEYQTIVYGYAQCLLFAEPVPFWPAPDNAPGICSCNSGLILHDALVAINNVPSCVNNATKTLLLTNPLQASVLDGTCECCMESVVVSAFYSICPTASPSLLGLTSFLSFMSASFPWQKCGSALSQYDCIKDLDFIAPTQYGTTGAMLGPASTPVAGTETPTNKPGQVTAPPSGTSFVWNAIGTQFTILASAPEKGGAATVAGTAQTGSGATAAAGTAGTAATGTSGSAATSAGAAKSGAESAFRVDFGMIVVFTAVSWAFAS